MTKRNSCAQCEWYAAELGRHIAIANSNPGRTGLLIDVAQTSTRGSGWSVIVTDPHGDKKREGELAAAYIELLLRIKADADARHEALSAVRSITSSLQHAGTFSAEALLASLDRIEAEERKRDAAEPAELDLAPGVPQEPSP